MEAFSKYFQSNLHTLRATELSREYLALRALQAKGMGGVKRAGEAGENCSGEVVGEVADMIGVDTGVEVEVDEVGVENRGLEELGGVGDEETEFEDDWLELLGELQVEDSAEELSDRLRMILFLTIRDSAIFTTPSLSSSVRKWIARRRARCLLILFSSLVALCSLARWEARALVSPCTREMEL